MFDDVLGLKTMNDETGYLTLSPDLASYKDGVLKITSDIRFPSTHKLEEITDALTGYGVAFAVNNYQPPLYNDPNGKLITTLMKVYNDVAGTNEQPIAIGGGTYARALKCGCAFGPEVCGEEATIHQANEYVTFDRIRLMSDVYYNAIKAVCTPMEKTRSAVAKLGRRLIDTTTPVCEAECLDESCEATEVVEPETKKAPIEGTVIGSAIITRRIK